jgi:hypothetical protein
MVAIHESHLKLLLASYEGYGRGDGTPLWTPEAVSYGTNLFTNIKSVARSSTREHTSPLPSGETQNRIMWRRPELYALSDS